MADKNNKDGLTQKPSPLLRKFRKLQTLADVSKEALSTIEINSEDDIIWAESIIKNAKELQGEISNKAQELCDPYEKKIKQISSHSEDLMTSLSARISWAQAIIVKWRAHSTKK